MTEYVERFARQTIQVLGEPVQVLILGDGAELPIGANLSEEMDRVSAQLGYWGAVMAAAKQEMIEVDAHYRRFRANCCAAVFSKDPKAAEWKVKAAIEATDGFIQHKSAVAKSESNFALVEAMFKAFDKKAGQLQSRGANVRSEKGAYGLSTPAEPRGWNLSGKGSKHDDDGENVRRASSSDEREKRMQEINKARLKKARKRDRR